MFGIFKNKRVDALEKAVMVLLVYNLTLTGILKKILEGGEDGGKA